MYCLIFRRLARPSSQDWNWKILFYAAVLWILALVTIVGLEGCYFSLRLQVFVYQYNKPEDKFHTIFYVNNQFSLKLTVKLIEVILNYYSKDCRWWEVIRWNFHVSGRLSYLFLLSHFSICNQRRVESKWVQSKVWCFGKICFGALHSELKSAHGGMRCGSVERNSSQCFIRRLAGAKSEDHISKQLASFCLCSSEQKQARGCGATNRLKYKIEHYWFTLTRASCPHINSTIGIHAPLTFNIKILYIEYFQPHHTIVKF